MVGRTIEARRRLPWPALALLAGAFALVGWGVATGRASSAILAALPAAIGLLLLITGRGRPFAARFIAEGIERLDPGAVDPVLESIPYATLTGVRAGALARDPAKFRDRRCPPLVEHAAGSFWIPSGVDAPAAEIYRFLAALVPPDGGRDVNPQLLPYLRPEEEGYGPEWIQPSRAPPAPPR